MYEKHFLQDVAKQNFSKYNISTPEGRKINPGVLVSANTSSNLGPVVGQLFSGLPISGHKATPLFFLPDFDSVSKCKFKNSSGIGRGIGEKKQQLMPTN